MEPSAVAARRTRASLALAAVGAIVLMAGVALALAGEATKLEHPVRPPPLIVPGLILAFLGLALGASAAVTILLDAPTRLPAAHPFAAPGTGDRSAFGPPPAAPAGHGEIVAGEVLSSSRLPGPVPPGPAAPGPAAPGPAAPGPAAPGPAAPGPVLPGPVPSGPAARTEVVPGAPLPPPGPAPGPVPGAREPLAGEVTGEVPGYSDAGWGAGTDSRGEPDPPAEPPREIHHPVRR